MPEHAEPGVHRAAEQQLRHAPMDLLLQLLQRCERRYDLCLGFQTVGLMSCNCLLRRAGGGEPKHAAAGVRRAAE